jgi:hypothetical protein
MGWDLLPTECRMMWYLLPDISLEYRWREGQWIYIIDFDYDIITSCVYNIFTIEKGEIISGRLFDFMGKPIEDATVTALIKGGKPDTAVTTVSTSSGIYGLKGLNSNTTYIITVEKEGYEFESAEVTTGKSENNTINCGNVWGININGDSDSVTIGAGKISWIFPMSTSYPDARTQTIYLADEIVKSGNINSLSLEITKAPAQTLENWTIRMKHTSLDKYPNDNCSLETDGWTTVYQNDESIDNTGWHKFELQTPFAYNGNDNLMVDFSYNNDTGTSHGMCRVSSPGGKRSAYSSRYNDGDPLDWQGKVNGHTNVPDVIISFSE